MNITRDPHIAAKCDLTVEIIRQFGEVRLKVTGTSMLPAVWPGDVLTIRQRDPTDLVPGRIVLCYRNQIFVVHRFVGHRGKTLITRGDALIYEDPPFGGDQVLGEVISIQRDGCRVDSLPACWNRVGSWVVQRSEICTRIFLGLRRFSRVSRAC
jgi:signal peptidase I